MLQMLTSVVIHEVVYGFISEALNQVQAVPLPKITEGLTSLQLFSPFFLSLVSLDEHKPSDAGVYCPPVAEIQTTVNISSLSEDRKAHLMLDLKQSK